nr:RHS repeat domain-containing protein [Pseudomonas putida]
MGRETQYQYDPEGRVTQVTDALEKSKYLSWNTCGQLLSYRDCSNAQTLYHYDAHAHPRRTGHPHALRHQRSPGRQGYSLPRCPC